MSTDHCGCDDDADGYYDDGGGWFSLISPGRLWTSSVDSRARARAHEQHLLTMMVASEMSHLERISTR